MDEDTDAEAATGRPPLPRWGQFAREFFLTTTFGIYPFLVILDDVTSGSLDDSGPWWIVRGFVAVPGLLSGFVWAYAAYRVPLSWWGRTAQVLCLTFALAWFTRGLVGLFVDFETGDLAQYGPLVASAVFGLVWVYATSIEHKGRTRAHPDHESR